MVKTQRFPLLLLAFLLILSCSKDDDSNPSVASQIIISPDDIMLNDNETGTISLSVQPPNNYEWNVTTKPDWLDISPSSGTIDDQITELTLTPNPEGLDQGKHSGVIEIITNGAGKAKTNIQLCVEARPRASVDPGEVMFAAQENIQKFTIKNIGTGFLNWEIQNLPSWFNVFPSTGILDSDQEIEVTSTVYRNGLDAGTITGQALLVSNSEDGDIPIDITLEVPELGIMTLSESSVDFGYIENDKFFYIKNEGNVDFEWAFDNNSNSYISLFPDEGSIVKGDSMQVNLMVDRANLVSQTYNAEVILSNNKDGFIQLPVQVNHYDEEKWLIEGRVIDAEYDRNNDVIVIVSETPNELRVFDPSDNTIATVALATPPTCVSIGLDGDYAAVGHDGRFSYVNLSSMEIEKSYAVTADAFDIILAPNDFVYVFPREDQWERIRCINLANGTETEHWGNSIRERTKVVLHPSGDFIYGADNGLSPSDFEKYDIRNGTATMMYDSPYHGDYAFSGDIWISEDGNRLFAKSRNVFNSSTNENNDMTYNGELVGEGRVKALDFSAAAERVYAVFTIGNSWDETPGKEVRMYETDFLGFQGTIQLPGFLIPDGQGSGNFYDSEGHFGFFNSSGTKYYVVVKAVEGSGAQNEWAIATIDVE